MRGINKQTNKQTNERTDGRGESNAITLVLFVVNEIHLQLFFSNSCVAGECNGVCNWTSSHGNPLTHHTDDATTAYACKYLASSFLLHSLTHSLQKEEEDPSYIASSKT